MTIKTTIVAAVIALAPTFSFGMGCQSAHHSETTASSCAEGTMLDPTTGTCLPVATS